MSCSNMSGTFEDKPDISSLPAWTLRISRLHIRLISLVILDLRLFYVEIFVEIVSLEKYLKGLG